MKICSKNSKDKCWESPTLFVQQLRVACQPGEARGAGAERSMEPNGRKSLMGPGQEGHRLYSQDRSFTSTASQHPHLENRAVPGFEGGWKQREDSGGQHQGAPHHPSATRGGVRERGSQWVASALLPKRESFQWFIEYSRAFHLFHSL